MFLLAFLVVPEGQLLHGFQDRLWDQHHLPFHHLQVYQVLLLAPEALALQGFPESLVLLDSLLALLVHLVLLDQESPRARFYLALP